MVNQMLSITPSPYHSDPSLQDHEEPGRDGTGWVDHLARRIAALHRPVGECGYRGRGKASEQGGRCDQGGVYHETSDGYQETKVPVQLRDDRYSCSILIPETRMTLSITVNWRRCGLVLGLWLPLGSARPALSQAPDTAFFAMQALGTHRFDDLADGGRIALSRSPVDTAGVRAIREHLAQIARAFAAGDFRVPGVVHSGKVVPGTDVMAAKRGRIDYQFRPTPGGGEVRIRTSDREALEAIHAFLAFQRRAHHAAGDHVR